MESTTQVTAPVEIMPIEFQEVKLLNGTTFKVGQIVKYRLYRLNGQKFKRKSGKIVRIILDCVIVAPLGWNGTNDTLFFHQIRPAAFKFKSK